MRRHLFKHSIFMILLIALIIIAALSGCKSNKNQNNNEKLTEKIEQEQSKVRADFDQYCDTLAKKIIEESPLNATFMYGDLESLGLENLLYELDDASIAATKKQIQESKAILKDLKAIDIDQLTDQQQKTYKMLRFQNESIAEGEDFIYYMNIFQPTSGVQINIPISLMQIELESEKEVQAYIQRVKQLPGLFDQFIVYEKERAKENLVLPPYMYETVLEQLKELLVEPENFMMYLSFCDRVDALEPLTQEAKTTYKASFLEIIKNDIYPAYQNMEAVLKELKEQSPNKVGLSEWPMAQEYYDYLVKFNTSYDMDTEDLRKWAADEFNASIEAVQKYLTNHPEMGDKEISAFFDKINSREALNKVEAQFMEDAFLDYKVKPASENIIPPYLEEHLPPAFYFPISIDGEDYGNMYMTKEAMSTITMDTLVTDIHENIPGHHLYYSLLYQSDLPLIRKVYDFSSYVEGWAQYVQDKTYEYAATDAEFAEFWKNYTKIDAAFRVLMDSQINYDGMPKEEAIKQMLQFGYDQPSAKASFDRMLANPGELITYFYGSDIIENYYQECQEAQGDKFDVKAFHDLILNNGGLPFYIMDDVVKEYIDEQ